MSAISIISIIIGISFFVVAVYMVRKVYKVMDNLDQMLDDAMNGTYEEKIYDESRMSKLEAKLSRILSANKLSLKRLEEQQNQIQQTVSDLSHQTKTPLANLLLYTEYLSEKMDGNEEGKYIVRIAEQVEKLDFLIQSLVKTSRLEHDLITVHCKEHSLDEFMEELFSMYQEKARKKEIHLQVEYSGVWAAFDEKWTLEAVGNILDNAVKYTNPEGTIWIRAKEYELFSMIEIEDDGIGISKEEQANIFTRFYRSPKVNQMPGVGIGLYLSRKIISLEGGYLKVLSEEGKGAKFQVYLPKIGK